MFGLFGKNDWTPVWVCPITAEVQHNIRNTKTGKIVSSYIEKRDLCYEIKYSKSRNDYKLILHGKDAEFNDAYKIAIQKLNEFQNEKK